MYHTNTELIQQPLPPSPFPPPSSAPLFLSQGTSVVSPIITPVILISIMVLYATNSPARLLHTNCVVFFTAFYFPMSKMVIYMMVIESSLHLRIWLQQPLLPLSLLLPFLLLSSLLPPPLSLSKLSGMTKSPFPLLDPIMLGPLLAYLNVYFGTPLSELFVMIAVAVRRPWSM